MTLHSRNRTAASTKLALQAPLDICSQMPGKVGYDDGHESIVIAILRQAMKVPGRTVVGSGLGHLHQHGIEQLCKSLSLL